MLQIPNTRHSSATMIHQMVNGKERKRQRSSALTRDVFTGLFMGFSLLVAIDSMAQEARLEIFPIRPIYVEAAYRQTFEPDGHEVGVQAGFTALRYGDLELNGTYQYFGLLSENEKSNIHSVYLNPRWNNFLDILDFPSGRPLSRLLRHILFGPLEDRAVPFVGALIGTVLSGPGVDSPGFSYGGQIGVRFPVAHSVALEVAVGYFAYEAHIHEGTGQQRQLLLSTGFAF